MIAVVDTFQSYPSRDHLRPLATPSRWVAQTLAKQPVALQWQSKRRPGTSSSFRIQDRRWMTASGERSSWRSEQAHTSCAIGETAQAMSSSCAFGTRAKRGGEPPVDRAAHSPAIPKHATALQAVTPQRRPTSGYFLPCCRPRASSARSITTRSAMSLSRIDCLVRSSPSRLTVRTARPWRSMISTYCFRVS